MEGPCLDWYNYSSEKLETHLKTNVSNGLSQKEAKSRLKRLGPNQLKAEKKVSNLQLFIRQFKDFIVALLIVVTCIAAYLGEAIDALVIVIIICLNSLLGFWQEKKAQRSLEKLKSLTQPESKVLRDGQFINVLSQELVVGDIVAIEAGMRVPCDLRLIDHHQVVIDESALTGETVSVHKSTTTLNDDHLPIHDQVNMAFMGTLVKSGRATGVVVSTGVNTEVGQIASLITTAKKEKTPLEQRLEHLGHILIVISLALTALVVFFGIIQGQAIYQMFLSGISLAVAIIPEGLPAIVTVVLSLGVQRMIKQKVIIKSIQAVETLGATTVICSDKTGTLTENKMSVSQVYLPDQLIAILGGYRLTGGISTKHSMKTKQALNQLLKKAVTCTNATIKETNQKVEMDGDASEIAILMAAVKCQLSIDACKRPDIIKEIPFDSDRKRMSVLVKSHHTYESIVKGAPEVLLNQSNRILKEGQVHPLSQQVKDKLNKRLTEMTKSGQRVMAICYKPIYKITESMEDNLIFMGYIGLNDPPRKHVKQAIRQAKKAGVKTVMITGDHTDTASAIAKQLTILPSGGQVITGQELVQMSDDELCERINSTYVFARVTPFDKLRIVKAYQQQNEVVAMTGDGVNDAPALKKSDVGISMGIAGTDISKETADIILMDDNFKTIIAAIREGRIIYQNIKKFIRYILTSNTGELLVMLFSLLIGLPLPLVPVQILWVNLITDGLPALALGLDKGHANIMDEPPRKKKESLFSQGVGTMILLRGLMMGLMTFLMFILAYQFLGGSLAYARTMTFMTLILSQLVHAFDCRNHQMSVKQLLFGNGYLLISVLLSIVQMIVIVYYPPLQAIFHTVGLNRFDWIFIIMFSLFPTFFFHFTKK
ncbi:Ca2+-transporting ATPase [Pelagirhabdus alkalitolerans]|uniref:Ca2+-transporting ATPase n=1 Tax=Pelagirhabdus alkalitolerans TaxID=1612202 RepID=A0A1G6H1D5_9BACI|nr:cation-translocating P-type ATPase [Pelagirhabdus alkalitolerans]SDB87963.1 Ca2+-transporting ATPase [Pelagirhabdus alkalitolerans]